MKRALIFLFVAAPILILGAKAVIAQDPFRLAFSKRLALDVYAKGAPWCRSDLDLEVVLHPNSPLLDGGVEGFLEKLGPVIEAECPQAERHAVRVHGPEERWSEVFLAAAKVDGWAVTANDASDSVPAPMFAAGERADCPDAIALGDAIKATGYVNEHFYKAYFEGDLASRAWERVAGKPALELDGRDLEAVKTLIRSCRGSDSDPADLEWEFTIEILRLLRAGSMEAAEMRKRIEATTDPATLRRLTEEVGYLLVSESDRAALRRLAEQQVIAGAAGDIGQIRADLTRIRGILQRGALQDRAILDLEKSIADLSSRIRSLPEAAEQGMQEEYQGLLADLRVALDTTLHRLEGAIADGATSVDGAVASALKELGRMAESEPLNRRLHAIINAAEAEWVLAFIRENAKPAPRLFGDNLIGAWTPVGTPCSRAMLESALPNADYARNTKTIIFAKDGHGAVAVGNHQVTGEEPPIMGPAILHFTYTQDRDLIALTATRFLTNFSGTVTDRGQAHPYMWGGMLETLGIYSMAGNDGNLGQYELTDSGKDTLTLKLNHPQAPAVRFERCK